MRALVVDPGKVTGYGFLTWNVPSLGAVDFVGAELPMNDFIDQASRWVAGALQESNLVDLVICETFDVRADTAQKVGGGPLWSSEQIGILRFWCRWRGIPFVEQTPSDMKSFDADKAKTKKLGWWQDKQPGERGHRRDAASHALLYAMRHHLIDPRVFL